MRNLNRATIIGNLTQDPELRTTSSGFSVVNFGVATNLTWTDKQGQRQEIPEFHNIVAWRGLAEVCAQYLRKGNRVYIEGRLQTRNWDDPNGFKRYKTEIVADNMIMLERPPAGGNYPPPAASQPQTSEQPTQSQPQPEQSSAPTQTKPANQPSAPAQTPENVPVVDSETPAQAGGDTADEEEVSVEEIPF